MDFRWEKNSETCFPYSTLHEPKFYIEFPQDRGENSNQELIFEDWMSGTFHSFKRCFNAKQQFSHDPRKSRVSEGKIFPSNDTKESASCINPLQLYHTLCAFTDHSYWLYRYQQDSKDTSNGNSVQMRSRKLNSILLLSAAKSSAEIWLWIFMDANDVEEGRTHLHFQIPGRLLQG